MPGGRPTVMTAEVVAKLEEAFLNGATDKEASFVAGISPDALYDYCKTEPSFSQRKEQLKEAVKYRAKLNVAKAINEGDKPLSQWYLERKAKEEFSLRTEQTGKDGAPLIPENTAVIAELTAKLNAIHGGTGISGDGQTSSAVGTEAQD